MPALIFQSLKKSLADSNRYFTIPTVAGWIIQAGGMGSYNRSINNTAMQAGSAAGSVGGAVIGNVTGRAGKLLK